MHAQFGSMAVLPPRCVNAVYRVCAQGGWPLVTADRTRLTANGVTNNQIVAAPDYILLYALTEAKDSFTPYSLEHRILQNTVDLLTHREAVNAVEPLSPFTAYWPSTN